MISKINTVKNEMDRLSGTYNCHKIKTTDNRIKAVKHIESKIRNVGQKHRLINRKNRRYLSPEAHVAPCCFGSSSSIAREVTMRCSFDANALAMNALYRE